MKAAFIAALIAALVAVSWASCVHVPVHKCVKDPDSLKCTAVKVCEDGGEKCGDKICKFPFTCASAKRKECKKFVALKHKCEAKKVCKAVKKPCGDGFCSLTQDCIKDVVCTKKIVPLGRRLMGKATATSNAVSKFGGSATANSNAEAIGDDAVADANSDALAIGKDAVAVSDADALALGDDAVAVADANSVALGGVAVSEADAVAVGGVAVSRADSLALSYTAPYIKPCPFCKAKEILECQDTFTCVAKDPCVDVIVKKCVKEFLTPGIDVCHGGLDFYWTVLHKNEKCGDEFCGYGFKCADVIVKKCSEPCGDKECPFGFECVTEEPECEELAFLETICRDVFEPVCVPLTPYAQSIYDPPCKTVFKCDEAVSTCGNSFCPAGHKCVVDFVKQCEVDPIVVPIVVRPAPIVVPTVPLPVSPRVVVPVEGSRATGTSIATDDVAITDSTATVVGDGSATGLATAENEDAYSESYSDVYDGEATVETIADAANGAKAEATGDAVHIDKHD